MRPTSGQHTRAACGFVCSRHGHRFEATGGQLEVTSDQHSQAADSRPQAASTHGPPYGLTATGGRLEATSRQHTRAACGSGCGTWPQASHQTRAALRPQAAGSAASGRHIRRAVSCIAFVFVYMVLLIVYIAYCVLCIVYSVYRTCTLCILHCMLRFMPSVVCSSCA